MTELSADLQQDVERIQRLSIVPSILELVCRATGMGFSAVARVTEDKWIACAVKDDINFGLLPGGQLELQTTICNEIRGHGQPVVIDEVAKDEHFFDHHTPRQYGFQSYISIPIFLKDGTFFGTLCAIDPRPFPLKAKNMVSLFNLFADLISFHLLTQDALIGMSAVLKSNQQQMANSAEELRQYAHLSRHSLREPLRKLRLFTDKLTHVQDIPQDHEAKQIAGKINSLAGVFVEMVSKLADFSNIDSAPSGWQTVDLSIIANETRISLESFIAEKDAVITFGSLPIIEAKPEQMALIFSELVANALRFSRPGVRPMIEVEGYLVTLSELSANTDLDSARSYVRLQFTDNGLGIEEGRLQEIFDLFRHIRSHDTTPHLGSGLAQVKKVVRIHGGMLNVSSIPGQGSNFTVILPLRQSL